MYHYFLATPPCRLWAHMSLGTGGVAVFVAAEMKQSPADFLLNSKFLLRANLRDECL